MRYSWCLRSLSVSIPMPRNGARSRLWLLRCRIRWHSRLGSRISGIARIYDPPDITNRLSGRLSRLCWHWLRGHWHRLLRCTFGRINRRWHALGRSSIRRKLSHILALILPGRRWHWVRWWLLSTILSRRSKSTSGLHRRRPDIPRRGILPHSPEDISQDQQSASHVCMSCNVITGRPAGRVAGPQSVKMPMRLLVLCH
jgi:hypothetical protein